MSWYIGEDPDPHELVPISTQNIYKVFGNIHMLWMGRPVHYHDNLPPHLLAKISGSFWGILCSQLGYK
jgi:hypothetical protein